MVLCELVQCTDPQCSFKQVTRPFILHLLSIHASGVRCSSVVRAFAHDAMGRRIDPSWGGPIELFFVPASAPRLV